tara:strand:- start:1224 stop:2156 length:933 start_codon:yes stop_codon:yes gene_type:complete
MASDTEGGVVYDVQLSNGCFYRVNKKGERWSVKLRDAVNWPTPSVHHVVMGNNEEPIENYEKRVKDYEDGKTKGKPGKSLGVAVRMNNWPTPDATNVGDGVPWEKTKKQLDERRARVKEDVKKGKTKQGSGRSPNLAMTVQKPENWATPQASDHIEGARTDVNSNQKCLGRDLNQLENWATPNTMDHLPAGISQSYKESVGESPLRGRKKSSNLREQVNWPTPLARDYRGALPPNQLTRKDGKSRMDQLPNAVAHTPQDQANHKDGGKPQEQSQKTKQVLSPLWVAQIMGLNPLWCLIREPNHSEHSETE